MPHGRMAEWQGNGPLRRRGAQVPRWFDPNSVLHRHAWVAQPAEAPTSRVGKCAFESRSRYHPPRWCNWPARLFSKQGERDRCSHASLGAPQTHVAHRVFQSHVRHLRGIWTMQGSEIHDLAQLLRDAKPGETVIIPPGVYRLGRVDALSRRADRPVRPVGGTSPRPRASA